MLHQLPQNLQKEIGLIVDRHADNNVNILAVTAKTKLVITYVFGNQTLYGFSPEGEFIAATQLSNLST